MRGSQTARRELKKFFEDRKELKRVALSANEEDSPPEVLFYLAETMPCSP